MDEQLNTLENEEAIEIDANAEDLEHTIWQEELSVVVEVEAVEDIEIEVDEAVGWDGSMTIWNQANGATDFITLDYNKLQALNSLLNNEQSLYAVKSEETTEV